MRVFLFEAVTSGAVRFADGDLQLSDSLLREADAMIAALSRDFATLPDTELVGLRDRSLSSSHNEPVWPDRATLYEVSSREAEFAAFRACACDADWTLILAPEINHLLTDRTRTAEASGARLLSPGSALVELASDKHALLQYLAEQGLPVPYGSLVSNRHPLPRGLRFPCVLKPIDGAGCLGVQRIDSTEMLPTFETDKTHRIEDFCPGIPASVAVLCGPSGHAILPAGEQHVELRAGQFNYTGGELPLAEPLQRRAAALALRVSDALPQPRGYIGIDMVLGETADRDVVIEVNPRLTTSYVGLREMSRQNLAAAMIAIASGQRPQLHFDWHKVEFTASGSTLSKSRV